MIILYQDINCRLDGVLIRALSGYFSDKVDIHILQFFSGIGIVFLLFSHGFASELGSLHAEWHVIPFDDACDQHLLIFQRCWDC